MPSFIDHIIGPRVSQTDIERHGMKYGAPGFFLLIARVLLLVSLFFPFWQMTLQAPQYPNDLHLIGYVNNLGGDVSEIDSLNHYIGMRPLGEAAQLERKYGVFVIILFVVLLELASWIHSRWSVLLVLPAIVFPAMFLLDLYIWMRYFGTNLNQDAPLSNSVKGFIPTILGTGGVGQFTTIATVGIGMVLATAASFFMIVSLFFHRRAYLPLIKAQKAITTS